MLGANATDLDSLRGLQFRVSFSPLGLKSSFGDLTLEGSSLQLNDVLVGEWCDELGWCLCDWRGEETVIIDGQSP